MPTQGRNRVLLKQNESSVRATAQKSQYQFYPNNPGNMEMEGKKFKIKQLQT